MSETREAGAELERPILTSTDRRALLETHRRVDTAYRDVWDEAASAIVEKAIPLSAPQCAFCREDWGRDGCRAVRAVLLVEALERDAKERERRVSELTEALTPRFGVERLYERGNKTVELRMWIDAHTLMQARMPLVEATLAKMHAHWRAWFKDVGDLERIRADHLTALEIAEEFDAERYAYLTQEFQPSAPFVKRPGVPWEAVS